MARFVLIESENYPIYFLGDPNDFPDDEPTIELSDVDLESYRKVKEAYEAWQEKLARMGGSHDHQRS